MWGQNGISSGKDWRTANMAHAPVYIKKTSVIAMAITGGNDNDEMNRWGMTAEKTPNMFKMVAPLPKGNFRNCSKIPSLCFVCSWKDSSDWPGESPNTNGSTKPG